MRRCSSSDCAANSRVARHRLGRQRARGERRRGAAGTAPGRTPGSSGRAQAPSREARAPTAGTTGRATRASRPRGPRRSCSPPWASSSAAAMGSHSASSASPQSCGATVSPIAVQAGGRVAAAFRDPALVARRRGDLLRTVGRAVAQQAMEQEDVDEADRRRADADRLERIDVQAAHLDVLDAAVAQRVPGSARRGGSCAWAGWSRRTRSRSAGASWRAGGSRRRRAGRWPRTAGYGSASARCSAAAYPRRSLKLTAIDACASLW